MSGRRRAGRDPVPVDADDAGLSPRPYAGTGLLDRPGLLDRASLLERPSLLDRPGLFEHLALFDVNGDDQPGVAPAPPTRASALGVAPDGSRMRQRRERAARRTRRRRLAAAGVAVAATVAGAAFVAPDVLTHRAPAPSQAAATEAARTQRTLLLAVTGPGSAPLGEVLLAADPATRQGSVVLVPSRVLAQIPGYGTLPIGQALALPGNDLPRQALADLVGVTVDASLVLGVTDLAAIVDRVGGLEVDVDVPILTLQPDGTSQVTIPAGRQHLNGEQVIGLLTYRSPGEREVQRLPRFQQVVQSLVAALPADPARIEVLVEEVAAVLAGQGLPVADPVGVAAVLDALAQAQRGGDVLADTLPIVRLDTGGDSPAYRLDPDGLRRLVDARLSASVPAGTKQGDNRVLVLNGVGTPGVGEAVRNRIVPAGFAFVDSRNAQNADGTARFDYASSQVLVADAAPARLASGRRLAAALGLPDSAVRVATRAQSVADFIVLVGADFRP